MEKNGNGGWYDDQDGDLWVKPTSTRFAEGDAIHSSNRPANPPPPIQLDRHGDAQTEKPVALREEAQKMVDALFDIARRLDHPATLPIMEIAKAAAEQGRKAFSLERVHRLKTDPVPFQMVRSGIKRFEIRKDDRGFRVGDVLHLMEFDRETQAYSGRQVRAKVECIVGPGEYGLGEGIVAMGIVVLLGGIIG